MGLISYLYPTDSVRALKQTLNTDPCQWPGLILSSSIMELLKEGALIPLYASSPTPVQLSAVESNSFT